MAIVRTNFVSGQLTLGVNSTATTLTSTGFTRLAEVEGADRAVIVLDPFGDYGAPEACLVTVHDLDVTPNQVTVLRGQKGSLARSHNTGVKWTHAPLNSDFDDIEALIAAIQASPGDELATAAANTIQPDDASEVGTSSSVSRADHQHAITTAVAGASAPDDTASEGVATSFARSDHRHERETSADLLDLLIPVGTIWMYGGEEAPDGWLLCDGETYDEAEYPALFAVIGTSFGSGIAPDTFDVPDFRTKFPRGFDDGVNNVGDEGGEDEVTLTVAQLATHAHVAAGHTHTVGDHYHGINSHTHGPGTLATNSNTHRHALAGFGYLGLLYTGTYGAPPGYSLEVTTDPNTSYNTHSHTVNSGQTGGWSGVTTGPDGDTETSEDGELTTSAMGAGDPHPNVPSFVVVNFIIRAA